MLKKGMLLSLAIVFAFCTLVYAKRVVTVNIGSGESKITVLEGSAQYEVRITNGRPFTKAMCLKPETRFPRAPVQKWSWYCLTDLS